MILEAIILAAGEGVRMRSTLPKALHNVGGRPMLARVIEAANALKPAPAKIPRGGRRSPGSDAGRRGARPRGLSRRPR